MPVLEVQDPTGRTLEIQGDRMPNEAELKDIFSKAFGEPQEPAPDQFTRRPETGGPAGAMPEPVLAPGPTLASPRPPIPDAIAEQRTQELKQIPPLSPEQAEQVATTPFVNLPRLNDPEMPATSAIVNTGEGLIEQALMTPASGALLTAFKIPGVRQVFSALLGAAATKAGAQKLGEASVTGNRQELMEGALLTGLGATGVAGGMHERLLPRSSETVKAIESEVPNAIPKREAAPMDVGASPEDRAQMGAQVREQATPETPQAQVTPAIQVKGKTFTGEDHVRAYENAKASGQPDTSGAQEGFVDAQGNFLSREQAAQQTGLPTETELGKLHSSDLAKETDEQIAERMVPWGETALMDPEKAFAQGPQAYREQQQIFNALSNAYGPQRALAMTAGKVPYPSLEDFRTASSFYYEERGRKIALDIALTAKQLGAKPPKIPEPSEFPSARDYYYAMVEAQGRMIKSGAKVAVNLGIKENRPSEQTSAQEATQPNLLQQPEPERKVAGEAPKTAETAGGVEPAAPSSEALGIEPAAPSSEALGIVPPGVGKGVVLTTHVGRKLYQAREGFRQLWESTPNKRAIDQTLDGAETLAHEEGRQVYNSLRLEGPLLDRQAAFAIVEADQTYAKLGKFLQQVRGKHLDAERAVRHAMVNYNRLQPLAEKVKSVLDAQIDMEQQAGIDTEYRESYVPHIIDTDLLMGTKRPIVLSGRGGGLSTAFRKGRTFDTIFDAIEQGYMPKTMDVAKLVEHRVRAGQEIINRKAWANSFKQAVDPLDNQPIVRDIERKSRGPGKPDYESAPMGYEPVEIIPGVRVAVHQGYSRLFRILTGQSAISESLPGSFALHSEGTIKHGLLLFDTFHASRILQKKLFLTRSLGGLKEMGSDVVKGITGGRIDPALVADSAGYKKGYALLEYSDTDLAKAVAAGDITPEMAHYARANRATADLLMKNGLNVGRIQEALYSEFVRQWPVIGSFTKWVFDKMTRGAMLESGIIEFERQSAAHPNWTPEQTAQYVGRRLNQLFGNLGRQGVFKGKTMQDVARLGFLAPQWVESMARTELGGLRELTVDPLIHRQSIISGTLARSVGQGVFAYLIGTQLLNMVTRGKPTWENPEEGHKMDAWIPDITGKTNGFFISPLSVVAEISHDIVRYMHTEGSLLKAGARILSNKFSPFLRASEVLYSGKTPTREVIPDDWTRLLYAGFALMPTPIPASPFIHSDYPGQIQRQLTASLGFKTEPAPTYTQRVSKLAQNFAKEMGRDSPIEIMHVVGTGYGDLRAALRRGDDTTAKKRLEEVRKGHTDEQVLKSFHDYVSRPFTGSNRLEEKFKRSLNEEERDAYRKAKAEKKEILSRLKALMREE